MRLFKKILNCLLVVTIISISVCAFSVTVVGETFAEFVESASQASGAVYEDSAMIDFSDYSSIDELGSQFYWSSNVSIKDGVLVLTSMLYPSVFEPFVAKKSINVPFISTQPKVSPLGITRTPSLMLTFEDQ